MRILAALFVAALALHAAAAFTVENVEVPSAGMKRSLPAVVIRPDGDPQTPRPVLYLLHGFGDNVTFWLRNTTVGELADRHQMLVVCPFGERSWYFDSPERPELKFETYMASELVAFIDGKYRTIRSPGGRATAGFSMGGHGAMFLAIRHRDVFGATAPMGGGVDFRPFPENWELRQLLGTREAQPKRWEEYTVLGQAKSLKSGELAISIDCGVDDFFIGVNRALHAELLARKIAHVYTERPGMHTGGYCRDALPSQMLFLAEFFKAARPR
jgi:S-formylglutathione hydrolase FrmB